MENLPKVRMIICGSCGFEKRWNISCQKCGRPSQYKPSYCDILFIHCANGKKISSFAKVLNISRSTLYSWIDKHTEFKIALKAGEVAYLTSVFKKNNPFNLKSCVMQLSLLSKLRIAERDYLRLVTSV